LIEISLKPGESPKPSGLFDFFLKKKKHKKKAEKKKKSIYQVLSKKAMKRSLETETASTVPLDDGYADYQPYPEEFDEGVDYPPAGSSHAQPPPASSQPQGVFPFGKHKGKDFKTVFDTEKVRKNVSRDEDKYT
jgi:hypothetical protein